MLRKKKLWNMMAIHYRLQNARLLFCSVNVPIWYFFIQWYHINTFLYFTRRQNIFIFFVFIFSFTRYILNVALQKWMYCDSTCQFQLNNKFNNKKKKIPHQQCLTIKKALKSSALVRVRTLKLKNVSTYEHFVYKTCCCRIKWSSIQEQNHASSSNWWRNDKVCAHWQANKHARTKAQRTTTTTIRTTHEHLLEI